MLTNENLTHPGAIRECGRRDGRGTRRIDRTTFTILERQGLQPGSLLEFSRSTGENIDIYAGDVLVGWRSALMDGSMAVRLADLRNAGTPSLQADEPIQTVTGVVQ
jgi:hypothetical protein